MSQSLYVSEHCLVEGGGGEGGSGLAQLTSNVLAEEVEEQTENDIPLREEWVDYRVYEYFFQY